MPDPDRKHRRTLLEGWFAAAVSHVDGGESMLRALRSQPAPAAPPAVIAIGKAAPSMATATTRWLESHGVAPASGVIISHREAEPPSPVFEVLRADHPEPGPASLIAATRLGELISDLPHDTPVWVLLSGGASSLIAAPRSAMSQQQLRAKFKELHRRGLAIQEMNAERRKLTRWGGGRLAGALGDREVSAWVVSDVVGNDLTTIGSGPLVPDSGRPAAPHHIVADGAMAAAAACDAARRDGYPATPHPDPIIGDARAAARWLAESIRTESSDASSSGWSLHAWHGETTVTLPEHPGIGGRAQHLALALAADLSDSAQGEASVLVAGTDGRDGPTDVAGAIVDTITGADIRSRGISIEEVLARAESNPVLGSVGALFRPEPTGTNVADLVLVLLRRP